MAMTFKTNLVPDQNLVRELGSSTAKWKINGVSDPQLTDTVTTVTVSGSGNAITSISASNGAITATKSATFLTTHQDISGKVNKTGDTMSGNLIVETSTSPQIFAQDSTTNGLSASLLVGSGHQNHGLYSVGYATDDNVANNTYTRDVKWMVYRNETGSIILNGTANQATADGSGNNIVDTYVKKSGDTMTGALLGSNTNLGSTTYAQHFGQLYLGRQTADSKALDSANPLIEFSNNGRTQYAQIIYTDYNNQGGSDSISFVSNQTDFRVYAPKVYGAVWNDYAEMRNVPESQKNGWKDISSHKPSPLAGRCVHEVGDGTMIMSTNRLERGCKIVSDTFGFNIGETDDCKTPIAVSGRALVYINEGREIASSHIGWPVCSGPNGTVSIMTEEEEEKYPSRIIGTISEIPNYEEWGTGKVKVNGRIWIYVK